MYQISAQWVEAFSIRKLLKFVKSSPEENTDDLLARLLLQSITYIRKGVDCNDDYFWKRE